MRLVVVLNILSRKIKTLLLLLLLFFLLLLLLYAHLSRRLMVSL